MTSDASLAIRLLGGVELRWRGRKLPPFPTQKSRSLFSYLVLNRQRRVPRDVLAGTFWGDRPDREARSCLRTDLWRLRKIVEPGGSGSGPYLYVDRSEVGFLADADFWLDVQAFEGLLGDPSRNDRGDDLTTRLRQAVELYRGDLLDGIYDEWAVFDRERLRELYLLALDRLMTHHQGRGEWSEAIGYGQRLLALDPLREHVHRQLMRLHCLRGDRGAALRQFETCRQLLRREMRVEPMEETSLLYRRIRDPRKGPAVAESALSSPSAALPSRATLDATIADLGAADRLVRRARRRLENPRSESA